MGLVPCVLVLSRLCSPHLATQPTQARKGQQNDDPHRSLLPVVVGATAYARTIEWQDERVEIERTAGALLSA